VIIVSTINNPNVILFIEKKITIKIKNSLPKIELYILCTIVGFIAKIITNATKSAPIL
jgi:hypothetical protein